MAIFVILFGALCGSLAAILAAMLINIGMIGAVAVFLGTSFAVASIPFVTDIMSAGKRDIQR